MKRIQIFLASSIREFEREREQLELFLRTVSDHFEAEHQIQIRPVLCENIDPAYTVERKQEEYNRIIRGCDMVFFIFFTKLGEFTYEEFLVAKKQFEDCGSPKIYTYFKNLLPGQTMETALADFMGQLDNTFGHYYNTFDHLDTIKLRMLLNIQLQKLDFAEVRVLNGQCCIDDIPVLPLNNVAEFSNNAPLQELLTEYKAQEAEYLRLKGKYASQPDDPGICRQYAQACAKRETLSQDIQKLQEQILRITLNICSGQVQGTITPRQKEAYRLFEQGNLTGCMEVLDSGDIDREYTTSEAMLEALARENALKYIREHMTAIDILSTMIHNPHRYKEIDERYQKIIPVVKKYHIEREVFFRYCQFLMDTGRVWEVKQFTEDLIAYFGEKTTPVSPAERARLYLTHGEVYTQIGIPSDAKRAYRKAVRCLKTSGEISRLKVDATEKLTASILAQGQHYRRVALANGILSYYFSPYTLLYRHLQKRAIRRLDAVTMELLEKDPTDANRLFRGRVHYNYAQFYKKHRNKRCIEHYLQALSIAESCKDADSFVEQCLQSIVIFYWLRRKFDKLSPYLERLIAIREKQFAENPDKYYFGLYLAYHVALYRHKNDADRSRFSDYSTRLANVAKAFHERMTELADADPNSYMRLSGGFHDQSLKALAEEDPEAIHLLSTYHDFSTLTLYYRTFRP